jgi:MoaA/NifB/PqqE/SkfB family radical SAM enzyme
MSVANGFPRRVSVEVTNHCDQLCRLCPRQRFTRPLGFIDPVVFEGVAAECAAHGAVLWLHFLGEPLLHAGIVELIATAKRHGVAQVGLSTNATRLSGALADALLTSGLDRLECSMDADDRASYEDMRGRDHFERVTANVVAFLERKRELGRELPVTSIQYMRTHQVESRLAAIVDRWRPLLGKRDFVMTIVPASFAGAIDVAVRGERRLRRERGVQGDDERLASAGLGARRPPCRWLFSSLMVLQDGTVTMCGADWDAAAPLGNVRETTLAAIWRGTELARRRDAHLDGRFGDVGACADCSDWRLADGSGYVNVLQEVDEGHPAQRRN